MVVTREPKTQIDGNVMERLSGLVGSKVSVEFAAYGESRKVSGTLLEVVPFKNLRIAPDDPADLSGFPFVGLNGAIRTVYSGDALVYDNSARVTTDLIVRGLDGYNDLKRATFGSEATEFVLVKEQAPTLAQTLRRYKKNPGELLKLLKS